MLEHIKYAFQHYNIFFYKKDLSCVIPYYIRYWLEILSLFNTRWIVSANISATEICFTFEQRSVADMFAETIQRVLNTESISSQYLI